MNQLEPDRSTTHRESRWRAADRRALRGRWPGRQTRDMNRMQGKCAVGQDVLEPSGEGDVVRRADHAGRPVLAAGPLHPVGTDGGVLKPDLRRPDDARSTGSPVDDRRYGAGVGDGGDGTGRDLAEVVGCRDPWCRIRRGRDRHDFSDNRFGAGPEGRGRVVEHLVDLGRRVDDVPRGRPSWSHSHPAQVAPTLQGRPAHRRSAGPAGSVRRTRQPGRRPRRSPHHRRSTPRR